MNYLFVAVHSLYIFKAFMIVSLCMFKYVKEKCAHVMLHMRTVVYNIGDDGAVCAVYLWQCAVFVYSSYLFASVLKLIYGKANHVHVMLSRWNFIYSNSDDRIVCTIFLLQCTVYV